MTKKELYELLDIETAEDFQYVENVSQYLECEEEIEALEEEIRARERSAE